MRKRMGVAALVLAVLLLLLVVSQPPPQEGQAPATTDDTAAGGAEAVPAAGGRTRRKAPDEEPPEAALADEIAARPILVEVKDEADAPILHAKLIFTRSDTERIRLGGARKPYTPLPTPDGRYELSGHHGPEYDLVIFAAGFRPAVIRGTQLMPGGGEPIIVRLGAGAAFEGVVQDPWGTPIEGATVEALGVDMDQAMLGLHAIPGPASVELSGGFARTDRDGRFVIGGLVANQPHKLVARKPGYVAYDAGTRGPVPGVLQRPILLEPVYICRWVAVNRVTRERVQVERGNRMRGRGLRRLGFAGAAGFHRGLQVTDAHTHLATVNRRRNWDGAPIDLTAEGLELDLTCPGYEDKTVSLPFEALGPDEVTTHVVELEPTAAGYGAVQFSLRHPDGAPSPADDPVMAGARPIPIHLTGEFGASSCAIQPPDWELRGLPAGHYDLAPRKGASPLFERLDLSAECMVLDTVSFDVPVGGVATVPLLIGPLEHPDRGHLVVKVLRPDGQPEPHARLSCSMRRGNTMGGGTLSVPDGWPTSTHHLHVMTGEITVTASKLGYEPASAKATIEAGKTTEVTLQLSRTK